MRTLPLISAIGIAVLVVGCSVRNETVRSPAPTTQRTTTIYNDPYSPTPATTTTTVTTPTR
jgi:PBP1b-binding outer membrane lipoprotein LpoB